MRRRRRHRDRRPHLARRPQHPRRPPLLCRGRAGAHRVPVQGVKRGQRESSLRGACERSAWRRAELGPSGRQRGGSPSTGGGTYGTSVGCCRARRVRSRLPAPRPTSPAVWSSRTCMPSPWQPGRLRAGAAAPNGWRTRRRGPAHCGEGAEAAVDGEGSSRLVWQEVATAGRCTERCGARVRSTVGSCRSGRRSAKHGSSRG